ncbi:DUF317 domain-containing protein [Streptomyces sp. SBT349]|uniref:DUF317 domain-containing protein n=1 Tax=Streptomyces sp. SBT349 TaxID=1580539 RepID=UPI00066BE4C8|nr:DUF317 domain-containing protein [Streptomyces sp. SBT349]
MPELTPIPLGDADGERPDHLVTPRWLAGSDGDTATVSDLLVAAGWLTFIDETETVRCFPRTKERCLLIRARAKTPAAFSRDRTWHLWGRDGSSGRPSWNATFTAFTPPEVIATVADAMLAPPPPGPPEKADGDYLLPLAEAGWERHATAGGPARWVDPRKQATVYCLPIPIFMARREFPDVVGWHTTVSTGPDHDAVWTAEFSITTPRHLVTAMCSALTDPEPVPRYDGDINDHVRPFLHLG